LVESAFTLCPSGTNEETFRLWEALESGSIPIIQNSTAWTPLQQKPHPLPVVSHWSEVKDFLQVLGGHANEIDGLQLRVGNWWRRFKKEHQAAFATRLRSI
jgi:hypothetical protein